MLNECIEDARKSGMQGVAMATSEGRMLVGKKFLLKQGFESVDQAPPSFELMAKKFSDAPSPSLLLCFNGRFRTNIERRGKPSKWITLNALRVLQGFYS